MKVRVGDKIYISGEKRPYTVQCRDDRYIICTKPFNLQHTVQYHRFGRQMESTRR